MDVNISETYKKLKVIVSEEQQGMMSLRVLTFKIMYISDIDKK